MLDMQDVRQKFNSHKGRAKKRGIEFNLTFGEWWEIWKPHWNNRGVHKGQFVMCRTMDKGAYEIGNVRIDTIEGNARTRRYVNYDSRMAIVKANNVPVIEDEYKDEVEETWADNWLPNSLKGYRTKSVFD